MTGSITNENMLNIETKCPTEKKDINFFPPQNACWSLHCFRSVPENLALSQKLLPVPHINTHTQASHTIFHFFSLPIICYTQLLWTILN